MGAKGRFLGPIPLRRYLEELSYALRPQELQPQARAVDSHGEKTSCGCCFFVEGDCHLFGDVTFGMFFFLW